MISSNIKIYRGSKKTFPFKIEGKHDDRKLSFAAKVTKKVTDDRIIPLRNSLAGGSDTEILAIYDLESKTTLITIFLLPTHTQALDNFILYFDIDSINVSDDKDNEPIVSGKLIITPDVGTPYDNLPVETENLRHLILDTKDYEDFTLLLFTKASGPIPITIDELSGIVDRESFTEPEIDLCNLDGVTNTNGLRDRFEKIEKRFEKNENEVVLLAEKQTVVTNYIVEQDIFQEELDINNIIGV